MAKLKKQNYDLMKKFIIHAGLPKTATTTFQDILFYNLYKKKIINYFGRISLGFKAELNRISTDRLKYLIGITNNFLKLILAKIY